MARVLFVVAPTQFRDEELFDSKAEVERAGHETVVASTVKGTCTGMLGGTVAATETIDAIEVPTFDAVVFVGGLGAKALFNDRKAIRLAREFARAGRLTTAICLGPVILANAGLLDGKRATVDASAIHAIEAKGARYQRIGVVTDGNLVTGAGPREAKLFGQELDRQLAYREAVSRARPPDPDLSPPT